MARGKARVALESALREGRAALPSEEEWEGQPQWHCSACECDWRGGWIRFKRR